MVRREMSLYLLLGYLLIAAVGSTCVPVECLRCDSTGSCELCSNATARCSPDIPSNCKRDFQVSINSTGSHVDEGEGLTLTCVHNLPNLDLMFWWEVDGEKVQNVDGVESHNKSELVFKQVWSKNGGKYICFVNSSCGIYQSSPHDVTVNSNNVVLLVICGVSALVLVVVMGLIMKFKLQRDNAKHRERMKQRAQVGQGGGPAALTPRES